MSTVSPAIANEAEWLEILIHQAFAEDLPGPDVTTDNLGIAVTPGTARLIAKSDLVLSGCELFSRCILLHAPDIKLTWFRADGETALQGQTICTLAGDLIPVLRGERVALNFLQHLSGIATLTSRFVSLTKGTQCKILDTRKTLPGYRSLEKQAVAHGGGVNHRLNLSHAVMIKDNHIALAGGIKKAVTEIRKQYSGAICVECATLDEVKEAVELRPARILLDNLSTALMKHALELIPDEIEVEASGNMTLDRIPEVAAIGVDFISVGQLTHSAPAADLSLLFDWSP